MTITKKTIDGHLRKMIATNGQKRYVRIKTDMTGLYLVVTDKNRCTWTLIYSFRGKRYSFQFGHYDNGGGHQLQLPELTERQAYDVAIALKSDIAAGINIKEEYKTKQRHQQELDKLGILATVDNFTVNDVFDYFIEKVAKVRWKAASVKNFTWSYSKHIKPAVGQELWNDVTFKRWRDLFDGIAAGDVTGQESPTAARELAKLMKQAFKYAIYAEKVDNAAIKSIELNRIAKPGKVRTRVLNEYELGKVWNWCEPADTKEKLITKILLSTSARTGEVRLSLIDEWSLSAGVWTVPAEHSKNGDPIIRPIPDHLIDDITLLVEASPKHKPVLGRVYSRIGLSDSMANIHQQLNLPKFTAHDLRRTCSTLQYELNFEPVLIESMLGHRMPTVQRTYNHAGMLEGKRELLAKWHEYLEQCKANYLEMAPENELCA